MERDLAARGGHGGWLEEWAEGESRLRVGGLRVSLIGSFRVGVDGRCWERRGGQKEGGRVSTSGWGPGGGEGLREGED